MTKLGFRVKNESLTFVLMEKLCFNFHVNNNY